MEQNLVSIVIPAYNAEKTITRCVQSLLRQKYRHFELLLVNDGSKDQTLSLCQTLAKEDPRIIVIDKENGGVSSARNLGIERAKGEYIVFVDADDWVEPDYLSNFMDNKQPDGLVVCEVTHDEVISPKPLEKKIMSIPEAQIEVLGTKYIFGYPVNKMYDLHLIKRIHIRFDENITMGEDLLFCMQYLYHCQGKIVYTNKETYHYEISDDGAVKSHFIGNKAFNRQMLSEVDAIGNSKLYVFKKDPAVRKALENRYLKAAVNSLRVLAVYQKTKDPSYLKLIKNVRSGAFSYIFLSHNALSSKLSVLLSSCSPKLELYFWRKYNGR